MVPIFQRVAVEDQHANEERTVVVQNFKLLFAFAIVGGRKVLEEAAVEQSTFFFAMNGRHAAAGTVVHHLAQQIAPVLPTETGR